MIAQLQDIEPIQPLFKRYMWHMKQYFEIEDVTSWLERANTYLNLYRSEPERKVYVISADDGEIFGFALVNRFLRFNTSGNAIAEFYISSEYQGKGFGSKVAEHVFRQQPGQWEVCVSSCNLAGYKFWEKMIVSYTNGKYQINDHASYEGKGFSFSNK